MFQNETRHMSKMKDPVAGNELAHHFYSVHGGWYEDGPAFQIVKAVQLVGRRSWGCILHIPTRRMKDQLRARNWRQRERK